MKATIFFAGLCILACTAKDTYTTKYDNIDVDQILRNERLLLRYVECLKGKASCTKDGETLKTLLPDALHTGCTKCTDSQRISAKKVANYLIDERPAIWEELSKIYDKDGSYKKQYKEELKKEGVHI